MTGRTVTNHTGAANSGRRRFVALDRDGTVIAERYRPITEPAEIELLPGAAGGLRRMIASGLDLLIITNQSGVGTGTLEKISLDSIHTYLRQMLSREGVHLQEIYTCIHAPDHGCPCRKPLPGLLETAASELSFDPADCFVIGDKMSDLECGRRFGATTILVRTGYGAQMEHEATGTADHIVDDLNEAARVIENILLAE